MTRSITLGLALAASFNLVLLHRSAKAVSVAQYRAAVLADNPIGFWTLDETAGSTASDSSGNGLNGSYQGSLNQTAPGRFAGTTAASGFSSANFIEVADSGAGSPLDVSALTMSAWIRPDSVSGSFIIANKESTYEIGINNTLYQIAVQTSDGPGWAWFGDDPLSANTWFHIAATSDGDVHRTYINGQLVHTEDPGGTVITTTNNPFMIGRRQIGSGTPFSGTIDEFALFDRVLTPEEIEAQFNSIFFIPGIPEPSTMPLAATGLAIVVRRARRRRRPGARDRK